MMARDPSVVSARVTLEAVDMAQCQTQLLRLIVIMTSCMWYVISDVFSKLNYFITTQQYVSRPPLLAHSQLRKEAAECTFLCTPTPSVWGSKVLLGLKVLDLKAEIMTKIQISSLQDLFMLWSAKCIGIMWESERTSVEIIAKLVANHDQTW